MTVSVTLWIMVEADTASDGTGMTALGERLLLPGAVDYRADAGVGTPRPIRLPDGVITSNRPAPELGGDADLTTTTIARGSIRADPLLLAPLHLQMMVYELG